MLAIMVLQGALDPESWNAIAAWIGCIVSVVLLALKIADRVLASRVRSRLRLVLTEDVFFRYGTEGELVFLNMVFVGAHRPSQIRRVWMTLQRRTLTGELIQSSVPVKMLKYGMPKDRGGPTHDHFFVSSSPIDLIPPNIPVRRVMMCVVEENRAQVGGSLATFEAEVRQIAANGQQDPEAYHDSVTPKIESTKTRMATHVLSKNGHFRVRLDVAYADSEDSKSERTCCGILDLEVRDNGEADVETKTDRYCRMFALQAIGASVSPAYPETPVTNVRVKPEEP